MLAVGAAMLAATMAGGCLPAPSATSPAVPATSSSPAAESSAKPSASPRAFVAAIDAFVERVTSGKLTYHVAFDGSVRASINLLPIIGALDVSGENFQSSFTYDFSHDYSGVGKVRVQVRGVNGHGYVMAVVQHPYGESDADKLQSPDQAQAYLGYIGPFPKLD